MLKYFIVFVFFISCKRHQVNSNIIRVKLLHETSKIYKSQYGTIDFKVDTAIVVNDTAICVYKNGQLTSAGRVNKRGKKKGYWFFYNDRLMLSQIRYYKSNERFYIVSIVNAKW
jgi:hypothetical protein